MPRTDTRNALAGWPEGLAAGARATADSRGVSIDDLIRQAVRAFVDAPPCMRCRTGVAPPTGRFCAPCLAVEVGKPAHPTRSQIPSPRDKRHLPRNLPGAGGRSRRAVSGAAEGRSG